MHQILGIVVSKAPLHLWGSIFVPLFPNFDIKPQ